MHAIGIAARFTLTSFQMPIARVRTRSLALMVSCLAISLVAGCGAAGVPVPSPASTARLTDPRATAETRALFHNLRSLARQHVLFGHQDDLAYGYDWVAQPGRSDVKEAGGAYPAVYGWEVAGLENRASSNIDGVDFARMRGWIAEGYRRGGIITISWHLDNLATGKNAWDTTSAVGAVLPGGPKHEQLKQSLDRFAEFATSLRGTGRSGGAPHAIPIIFRPWHEMNGGWFWWGLPNTTPEQYRQLWRFTVTYLRDVKGVHNLLYAYAPNSEGPTGIARYMVGYPGDDYVDVLGYDHYFRGPARGDESAGLGRQLAWVVREAEGRGKIPAFTETGLEGIPEPTFWTVRLASAIKADEASRRIAYVMLWRNANRAVRSDRHFYAPYAGHPSVEDFRRLRADSLFMFEDRLPDLYRSQPVR